MSASSPIRVNIHKYKCLVSEETFGRPTRETSKNIFSITWQIYVSRMRVVTAVNRLRHVREHDARKDILTSNGGSERWLKKFRDKGIRDLSSWHSVITERWVGNVARMGENNDACMLRTRKPYGNRILGRPISRWKAKTKINFQGAMRVCGLYLSGSEEGTVVVYCERSNENSILIKCGEFFIAAGI